MQKEKIWTRDFISITVINFFVFGVFYVLMSVLPLYMVGTLHQSTYNVGLVITLFFVAAILIRPFTGQWLSRGSQRKIFIYSAIGFFVCTLFYPFARNIEFLLILRVFHGMTFGILTTAKGTICAKLIPTSRLGEGLSYFSMAMSLAMVAGPYIGINLANINAYNTAFIVCIIVSAVVIPLVTLIKVPEKKEEVNGLSKKSNFSWNDLFDKNAAPFALATFILAGAWSGVSAFLALYAKDLGLIKTASNFFIVYAVFILISRPFTGRWADKYGKKIIVYPCLVLFAVGMFLLSQTHSSAVLLLAGAIIGIGYGSVTPVLQTQTISSVEPRRVGIANSLFFNSMDAGMAIGAYVLGIVADVVGYSSIYLVGVALIVAAGIEYFALTQNKKESQVSLDVMYKNSGCL